MGLYALTDTSGIRYVGKTKGDAETRLKDHFADVRRGDTSHKANWIRKVGVENVGIIELPMPFGVEDLGAGERMWIAHLRDRGAALTNMTDGGEGLSNPSPETRARLSQAHLGQKRSAEHCAAISKGKMGRKIKPCSPEHRAALSRARRRTLSGAR